MIIELAMLPKTLLKISKRNVEFFLLSFICVHIYKKYTFVLAVLHELHVSSDNISEKRKKTVLFLSCFLPANIFLVFLPDVIRRLIVQK